MNEPTIETLARRLDKVEWENRWLKQAGVVALAVIAAVVLMGQLPQTTPRGVAKIVEAEKFVLRDANGRSRAALRSGSDGTTTFVLRNERGQPLIGMSAARDGLAALSLLDTNGTQRAIFSIGSDRRTRISLYDSKERDLVTIGASAEGKAGLFLGSKDHGSISMLVGRDRAVRLVLFDKARKGNIQLFTDPRDGSPTLTMTGTDGESGIVAGVPTGRLPGVALTDKDGKVVWGAP